MSYRDELIAKHTAKKGLRGKIDAHCISCVYDESQAGYWTQQVQWCTVTSCPLYTVRKNALKDHSTDVPRDNQVDIEELL